MTVVNVHAAKTHFSRLVDQAAAGEEITTVATYSDFRQFETAGRLIIPK